MKIMIALALLAGQADQATEKRFKAAAELYDAEWKAAEGPAKDKLRAKLLALQAKGAAAKAPGNFPALWSNPSTPKSRCGLDREHARAGAASLKMLAPDPNVQGFQAWIGSDEIPAAPGEAFTFSAWVLTSGEEAFAGKLQVKFRGPKNGVENHLLLVPVRVDGDRPVWTKVEGEAVAPEGTITVELSFNRANAKGGVAWIDEASLKTSKGKELVRNGGFEGR